MSRKRKPARPAVPPPKTPSGSGEKPSKPSFPIVGIGASAGGLEAFKQLLHALPVDTGMGFVFVQHLAPTHASNLAEILSRSTGMTVMEVRDESSVRPNHVFVIPPGRNMIISGGSLQLLPRESSGVHRSIDYFFRSLAEDQGHKAIGVVLSGTATDGRWGWRRSRPQVESRLLKMKPPNMTACRAAPSLPAAWISCCRRMRSPERSPALRGIPTWRLLSIPKTPLATPPNEDFGTVARG